MFVFERSDQEGLRKGVFQTPITKHYCVKTNKTQKFLRVSGSLALDSQNGQ